MIVSCFFLHALQWRDRAGCTPSVVSVVFPPGVEPAWFADFVFGEGVAYYEAEISVVTGRIARLERRRDLLAPHAEYYEEYCGRGTERGLAGPRGLVAAIDALDAAPKLKRNLEQGLADLHAGGPSAVAALLREFLPVAHGASRPDAAEWLELDGGAWTLEPDLERRLAKRPVGIFQHFEDEANEAAELRGTT